MSVYKLLSSNRRAIAVTALAALALGASGCTRLRTHQGYVGDSSLIDAVTAGVDNKQSVQASLGRPTFVGQFDQNDWYYFARDSRQLAFSKPRASDQTVLHVRFDDAGNVASVNKFGMEYIARINPEGDKTPTLGRESSFFEDLFGGIGTVGAPGAGGGPGQ
ncbi:outer membrane protein assembly factor BamE [Sphingorhabdus arenilitoris]|uniref:Outer membrane protein assembly factor BamE n=1 Tax=Sphingorhabdus arenilitoris TaxID=1490041 RepID=A0ABV8RD40_9SPHN